MTARPSQPAADSRPGAAAAWLAATRPRSLLVAISPVLVGAALGWQRTGRLDVMVAAIVLVAALLIQVASNLQNDVGYTVRGAERVGQRTGLPRATAQGWLPVTVVRAAVVAVVLLALVLGLWLVLLRGWPVLAMGVASLLAAVAYMGGPRPIAYTPFGEVTVFVFFGLVAVMGTDWVLTGSVGATSVLASVAVGGLAAAALAVNNQRDIAHDTLVGRRTLAVCVGAAWAGRCYAALLLGPFVLCPAMAWTSRSAALLLPLLLVPSALALRRDFDACPPGLAYNQILFRTFRLELVFAVLLACGAVLGRLVPI
ncbi:MAG: 1,4-dihydroxy-2-naphthoate octaprenyltransferase [Burkholderiales bacterium]|nr:1,4-dihydroxy-2-naphthoate octaprenyltransferase [Burkholderiales bacterium]